MANSVDPDETAHFEPSHQDLHCLQNSVLVCRTERKQFIIMKVMFIKTTFDQSKFV